MILTENLIIKKNIFIDKLNKNFIKENLILPYEYDENNDIIKIAISEKTNPYNIDKINNLFKKKIQTTILKNDILNNIIDDYFTNLIKQETPDNETSKDIQITSNISKKDLLYDDKENEPIIKLVNNIIKKAIFEKSTDIHIEPEETNILVRYRIDGILYDKNKIKSSMKEAISARIKILTNLDIAETRLPQDGRFSVAFAGQNIDFRVSIIPTKFGERIVMRILDKSKHLLNISDLGFNSDLLNQYKNIIQSPNGIILVTGPTGSGKTTTLYASLNNINNKQKNIITVEDPIEYQLNGISQIQVKPEIGLTFSSGLRAILRQDPDVIMIGEIRDKETLDIAIQSALTGHLVFSTIHTNNSISTIIRLYNMGLPSYLISSSISCIIAQRLIRKLCIHCKTKEKPEIIQKAGFNINDDIYKPVGCTKCNSTGYSGRLGIFETLIINETLREMILNKENIDNIKNYCKAKLKMKFLLDDIKLKIKKGLTSIDEMNFLLYNTK